MRFMVMGVAAAALLVTGCSKKDDAPVKRDPGKWKMDMTLVKLDIPGAPPEIKQGMEQMFSGMKGIEQCVTAEQIAKEDIEKSLSNAAAQGSECTFDKKVIAGETIDIAGTCKSANGQTANLAIKGTSGKTAQDITITSTGLGPDGKTPMTMEMRMQAKRTGDCA